MATAIYKRRLSLAQLLSQKSHFLFGPRQVGKSTLIAAELKNKARVYNLLDPQVFLSLAKQPRLLIDQNPGRDKIIVIDEIQKLPSLLNSVHYLIEERQHRFLLTGSSARKLKTKSTNLLAGRARQAQLMPLSWCEIPDFNLLTYLNRGGLPSVYNSDQADEDLKAYVSMYIKEEVQAEALVRRVPAFVEFLELLALSNSYEINYDSMAQDLQISPNTLKSYIEILNDTLLGFYVPGFTKTKKRKATARAKYYFFDVGVARALCELPEITSKGEALGRAFEHFIMLEVRAFLSYFRKSYNLCYWRCASAAAEVDIVVGNKMAIEIKSTTMVQDKHLKSLRLFKQEGVVENYIVVSRDAETRYTPDGITIYPWPVFLQQLWANELL